MQEISILIIEDNPDDLLLLEETLALTEEFKAVTFHAGRLEAGCSLVETISVDVVILDLFLPDSYGLQTYTSFQKRFPMVPVVIVSGNKDYEMAYEAVKQGAQDYLFKGEVSATAITRTIRYAIERQRLTTELRLALQHVKQLQGLLPICSHCKKIRDDEGYWNQLEQYFSSRLDTTFSHGICPDCVRIHFPEIYKKIKE